MSVVVLGQQADLAIDPSSGTVTPNTGPTVSYQASQCRVIAASATTKDDLTAELTSLQINGAAAIERQRRVTSTAGILGMTADVAGAGFGGTIQARQSSPVQDLIELSSFWLTVIREDAGRMQVIPSVFSSAPWQAPQSGSQTLGVGWTQWADGYAVEGVLLGDGDTIDVSTIPAEHTAYYLSAAGGISIPTSDVTLAAGEYGVIGANLVSNNTHTAGTLYDVGGIASGLENITGEDSASPTQVPGPNGVIASQPDRFRTYGFGFATQSDAFHDALLRDANGTRRTYRVRKQAMSGQPQWSGQGIVRASFALNMETDRCTWGVTIAADGAPTKATQ